MNVVFTQICKNYPVINYFLEVHINGAAFLHKTLQSSKT